VWTIFFLIPLDTEEISCHLQMEPTQNLEL
jgi:hypothetical protein